MESGLVSLTQQFLAFTSSFSNSNYQIFDYHQTSQLKLSKLKHLLKRTLNAPNSTNLALTFRISPSRISIHSDIHQHQKFQVLNNLRKKISNSLVMKNFSTDPLTQISCRDLRIFTSVIIEIVCVPKPNICWILLAFYVAGQSVFQSHHSGINSKFTYLKNWFLFASIEAIWKEANSKQHEQSDQPEQHSICYATLILIFSKFLFAFAFKLWLFEPWLKVTAH